jgi:hypothetical protein
MARCGSGAGHPKQVETQYWQIVETIASDSFQVYLIEVNSCPALSLCGQVLEKLLPAVIEEVFQKAVDPLFPGSAPVQRETLQAFKPLQIQTSRARALTRVHSTPATQDSTQLTAPSDTNPSTEMTLCIPSADSPSPARKLVKTNSAPVKADTADRTTKILQRSRFSSQNISKG